MNEVALKLLSYLLYVTYPALAAYLVWVAVRSLWKGPAYVAWVRKISPGSGKIVRVVLCGIAGAFATTFTVFVWGADAALFMRWVPPAGSVLFLVGCIAWRGSAAFWVRVIGWSGMVSGVAIPSQATLFLPIVALLSITLHKVPSFAVQGDGGRNAGIHAERTDNPTGQG